MNTRRFRGRQILVMLVVFLEYGQLTQVILEIRKPFMKKPLVMLLVQKMVVQLTMSV